MKVKAVKVNRAHYFLTDPRIILYQVNYKNILDFNCWLTIISKMLTKFIVFLVTNCLYTMNLTGRELTNLKKSTRYNIQNFSLQNQLHLVS